MPTTDLPAHPNLDQLKRQAKELLESWTASSPAARQPRLRDAQRAIAEQYGFRSWDALRAHVDALTDIEALPGQRRRRGLDYDDPVPNVTPISGPITRDVTARLAERGVSGVKVDASVPVETLAVLRTIPTLRRIDLSSRDDLVDRDLEFLEAIPSLTAVSLAHCSRIGDGAVRYLRNQNALEQINLLWTNSGDESVAVLTGKRALTRVILGRRLTDAGVARLREFPAFAEPGADDSFLAVSMSRNLTDLALTQIGDLNGVIALDLHMSVFGSPHYTARGVSHLKRMTSLEELNFHGPLATDDVLVEIAAIPRLRALHCQDIASGDDGFAALGSCTTLQSLGGRFCRRLTDRGFAAVARLPRLISIGLGGPRVSDDAMAALADAPELRDLGPILFGDAAFAYIARIPRLQRLNNMYNRATTDAATRHLRGHQRLVHYSAYGTQITDESLHILAEFPRLETLEFENCVGITDDGLAALATLPRLRRVSVWSCIKVKDTWPKAMRSGVDVKSEAGPPGHAAGYRFETLMDYPELPISADAPSPHGARPGGLLSTLAVFGGRCEYTDDGLRLDADPGADTRWIGLITREAFPVPLRITIVAEPIDELRVFFGGGNHLLVFDERGNPEDAAPWFLKLDSEQGQPVPKTEAAAARLEGRTRVTLEIEAQQQRLFVNGALRHTWRRDFAERRSRLGIGLRRSAVLIRELDVAPL